MGVPNYQLPTNFSANCKLTTIFLANCQLTVNPISTLLQENTNGKLLRRNGCERVLFQDELAA